MPAISGACFAACGRTLGYTSVNPECQQPRGACACLCHESNSGPR
jgi:hypothetical protein